MIALAPIDSQLTVREGLGQSRLPQTFEGAWRTAAGCTQRVAVRMLPMGVCGPAVRERLGAVCERLDGIQDERIVPMLGLALYDESVALLSPYVEGVDTAVLLQRDEWTLSRALWVSLEVARGLRSIHGAGPDALVHGALRPSVVRLTPCGAVRLVEMGASIVRPVWSATQTNGVIPSQGCCYLAPEQLFGIRRWESDVYALGAMMVLWMTGSEIPRRRLDPKAHEQMIRELRRSLRCHNVPRAIRNLVGRMVAFFPQDRPSAAHVVKCLSNKQAPNAGAWIGGVVAAALDKGQQPQVWPEPTQELRVKRTEWIPRATVQAARQVDDRSDEATKQMSRPVVTSRQRVSSRRRRMQTLWSTVYMAAGTGVALMLTQWAVLSVMSLWVLKQLV